jgi:tagatose-1,6-bisphosphate aldolase
VASTTDGVTPAAVWTAAVRYTAARRPRAVLSAGVPFDQFTDVIQIAFDEGGAWGFIAGRSVWREVVSLVGQERERFLATVARSRLERLVEVAGHRARPWTEMGGSRLREVGTAATA